MPADEERAHNERLLGIHRGNLQGLLERKAKYGLEVPLWLENQIKAEQEAIALYEPLAPSQKQKEVAESKDISLTTIYIQGTQMAAEQARQAGQNKEIIEQQARDALWRFQAKEVIEEVVARVTAAETVAQQRYDTELEIRNERQQEHDERMTLIEQALDTIQGQVAPLAERVNWIQWLIVGLVILGLVIGSIALYVGIYHPGG